VREAIDRDGDPQTSSADQVSPLTHGGFFGTLCERDIAKGMGVKDCWRGDAFIGRPWKTNEYEQVHLGTIVTAFEAWAKLATYLAFDIRRRLPPRR
jgi:hypothetical protein